MQCLFEIGPGLNLVLVLQNLSVRQMCSSTLLQFLLDYPVGEKRLKHHIHKLIANLGYEHEAGRLAAIDLATVLIAKLPREVLAEYAPVIFMPLVIRLVSDGSSKCREEVGKTITELVKVCACSFCLEQSIHWC